MYEYSTLASDIFIYIFSVLLLLLLDVHAEYTTTYLLKIYIVHLAKPQDGSKRKEKIKY